MIDDAISYYTDLLARQPLLADALCWTVVEPLTAQLTFEDVIGRLGGDPAGITQLPWDAAYDPGNAGASVVHLGRAGQAVIMAEINGSQGILRTTRLSQEARVHSAYWNANALSALNCAAFGYPLVAFEGLSPDQRTGLDICALDDAMGSLYAALETPGVSYRPVLMAIVEERTGIRLDDDWLADDRVAIVLQAERARSGAGHPGGCLFDPELEAALLLAPATAQDALAGELLHILVEAAQLGDEPEIAAATTAFAAGLPRGDPGYLPLQQLTSRLRTQPSAAPRAATGPGDPGRRRFHAAWAIQLALLPPAHSPQPRHSLLHARIALGDEWLPARTRLRTHLRQPPREG
jgi:hypothetical protein